ncbi:MAG: secondary thiamine-phosphate synthase enzyme YjbQ [Bacillota bacterium]
MTIKTNQRVEFCDITAAVNEFLQKEQAGDGSVLLFVPHTTAALTVNEGADPAVRGDLAAFLEKLVPHTGDYKHAEGNSDAHIKASLLGSNLYLPVKNGKLVLGFWQAVYFVEFDGPRTRRLQLQLLT